MSFSAFARIFEPHALAPPTKARLTAYGLGDCLYYFEYVAGPKFFRFFSATCRRSPAAVIPNTIMTGIFRTMRDAANESW